MSGNSKMIELGKGLAMALAMVTLSAGCFPDSSQTPPGATLQPPVAAQQPTAVVPPASAPSNPPAQAATPPAAAASQPGSAGAAAQPRTQPSSAQSARNPAALVYEQDSPSVVNITSVAVVRGFSGSSTQTPQGTGTGFIIDDQGHMVTNNHVVEDADQLVVTFKDGATMPAELVGRDPDNDLAVIRVDAAGNDDRNRPVRDKLKPVRMGDSSRVAIGEDAIAIGSPLGLQQTVTSGIVSAIRGPQDESLQGQVQLLGGAIQTDAAINPGNSGGPLFNAAGEVIGVNSAILSGTGGNIGIGFAIPVNVAKRVVPDLIQSGCYRHPIVGVTTIGLSQLGQALKRELGIPLNQRGLLVQDASGGAATSGLRGGNRAVNLGGGVQLRTGGDIITAIDGQELNDGGQLRAYIENNKRPGDRVTLTVLRGDQRLELQATLGERPNDQCR